MTACWFAGRPVRAAAALVALLACSAAAPAHQRARDIALNPLTIPADLGPPPPLQLEQYVPYAGSGNGSFEAQIRVKLRSGNVLDQPAGGEAWLYPDTAYTRWLLRKYAAAADGARDFSHSYPGEDGFPVQAPSVLRPFTRDSVVRRSTSCGQQGVCLFTGLQPGRYLLYAKLYQSYLADKSETTYEPEDPSGDIVRVVTTPREGYVTTGGFVLLSNGYYEVGTQRRYGGIDTMRVAAWFGCPGRC